MGLKVSALWGAHSVRSLLADALAHVVASV